jgi:hypothetical protein
VKYVVENFLVNSLGKEVSFTVINPINKVDALLNHSDEHQRNLVLKVIYAGRSILLPGNAGSSLYGCLCNNIDGFHDLFNDIAVFVFPHHGSWENGEQNWLESLLKLDPNSGGRACIISSDLREGRNHVPRVDYMSEISKRIPNNCSQRHRISYAEAPVERQGRVKIQEEICTKNIFLTSAAKASYYKVCISNNSRVQLFDGEESLWDFGAPPIEDDAPPIAEEDGESFGSD